MALTQIEFAKILNREPDCVVVKTNGSTSVKRKSALTGEMVEVKYIPVSYIENTLDEVFGAGLWNTTEPKLMIVGNEVVGTITLRVYHPVIKEWIEQGGIAAVQIRKASGSAITDINSKIPNALEMDMPHLFSDCLKNAAQKLGRIFGRNLNRDFIDQYDSTQAITTDDVVGIVKLCQSLAELGELKERFMSFIRNPAVYAAFVAKNAELTAGKLIESPKRQPIQEQKETVKIENGNDSKTA